MKQIAFITGITGQIGSFLAEFLLNKDYVVYGLIRRSSNFNTQRIEHIFDKIHLLYGDMTDHVSIVSALTYIKNTYNDYKLEIYNMAAQSHVAVSFKMPNNTTDVDANGVLNLLESVRMVFDKDEINNVRIYQSSTSEMFGKTEPPQNEYSLFQPQSPYAVAKVYAHMICKNYRESYNMYVTCGILFNTESERRGETFVTRKITMGIKKLIDKKIPYISLGNLNSRRDWSYTKDSVNAIWLSLQQEHSNDYVFGSGINYSVRDFVEKCFKHINIEIEWKGENEDEVGYNKLTGDILVKVDPKFYRPCEVENLLCDVEFTAKKLNYKTTYTLDDIVSIMMTSDLNS